MIAVLQTPYIVFSIRLYHNTFGKRVAKSPKIYFADTGLLSFADTSLVSHMLGILSPADMAARPLMGDILLLWQIKGLICIREGRALFRPSYVAATERGPSNESTPFAAVSIENMVVAGAYKEQFIQGKRPNLHFFRNSSGSNEVDSMREE